MFQVLQGRCHFVGHCVSSTAKSCHPEAGVHILGQDDLGFTPSVSEETLQNENLQQFMFFFFILFFILFAKQFISWSKGTNTTLLVQSFHQALEGTVVQLSPQLELCLQLA